MYLLNQLPYTDLVPMLFDASLRPCRERFGNLTPAITSVTHLLESLLFCRCPWCICAPFLGRWTRLFLWLRVHVGVYPHALVGRNAQAVWVAAVLWIHHIVRR